MLKNYLLLAVKNLRKQKMFSLINILGLTVGITCCFMIFLFILNELSYDSFHKKGKYIYRVMRVGKLNGEKADIPYLSAPYATALLNDYPEAIEKAVRVMPDNDLISFNNISFNEKNVYLTDSNFFQVFDFPVIAIFIACLGLFGLAAYTAVKRTKEIGVRKVLGSSIQNIVMLLSEDLLKPVLLGTLIAVPAGYYLMYKWLEGFAYRISVQWWMFAAAAAIAIMIALFTVSLQAIKTAVANPVKSLRTE